MCDLKFYVHHFVKKDCLIKYNQIYNSHSDFLTKGNLKGLCSDFCALLNDGYSDYVYIEEKIVSPVNLLVSMKISKYSFSSNIGTSSFKHRIKMSKIRNKAKGLHVKYK